MWVCVCGECPLTLHNALLWATGEWPNEHQILAFVVTIKNLMQTGIDCYNTALAYKINT